ncbi:MAG: type II secretion system F family protein [Hyphomicrobium sp.]
MPRFNYKAYDAAGVLLSGAIDVATRDVALQALSARGHHPVEIMQTDKAVDPRWWQRELFSGAGLNDDERLAFTRELATLLAADLPLDDALGVFILMPSASPRVRRLAVDIQERVRQGQSLSLALQAKQEAFPEYFWRLVKAAETSGALSDVMGDLAALQERHAEMRRRVSAALLYPIILMFAAAAAVLVIMTVLLPAVMPLFAEAGIEPPLALRIMSSVQAAFTTYWHVTAISVGLAVTAVLVMRRDAGVRAAVDAVKLKLPMFGRLIALGQTGRYCRTLSALLKNGVPLLDALGSTAGVLTNRVFARTTAMLAVPVAEGAMLSSEMQKAKVFSELSVRLAAVGERTGQLDGMLARAAAIHEVMYERDIDRMTRLIGPLLTLVVGVFTGGLIVSVMQAILSINDLALR